MPLSVLFVDAARNVGVSRLEDLLKRKFPDVPSSVSKSGDNKSPSSGPRGTSPTP